ncbi:hypothetical protein [Neobacillus bataviensis]|uniref:hypothetical protein n=1 Tax=Neobacillus bataviensis TaxID=220685 RepID=UPI001CBD1A5B|nr:hypothetical protein [Neobacillus bataviensis]
MPINFDALLEQYRSLWNNRILATGEKNSEEIIRESIKRELLDENSHPRIRKGKYEKYYSATKRVADSNIAEEVKIQLIALHIEMMEELN